MKKCLMLLLVMTMVVSMFVGIQIVSADDDISVYLNGNRLDFDVPPMLIDDRTMVPMRKIFESIGAQIQWDDGNQTITATKDGTLISMQIDNNVMLKNNNEISLDVPPKLIGDRTLVPVRAVAESFEADVQWSDKYNYVVITTNGIPVYTDYPFVPDFGEITGCQGEYCSEKTRDDGTFAVYWHYEPSGNYDGYVDALLKMGYTKDSIQLDDSDCTFFTSGIDPDIQLMVVTGDDPGVALIIENNTEQQLSDNNNIVYYSEVPWAPDFGYYTGLEATFAAPLDEYGYGYRYSIKSYTIGLPEDVLQGFEKYATVLLDCGFSYINTDDENTMLFIKGDKRLGITYDPQAVSYYILAYISKY